MGTTYLPAAIAAGAEIRAEAMVQAPVETDAAGRVSAVVYRQAGRDLRQPCRALVLAGGGVETPRLLLANDLGNANGRVGRKLLAHPATQVWGTFDAQQRAYRGYPSSLITEDFLRPPGADFAGGYLIQSLGVMPLTFATSLVRGGGLWGAELMAALEGARYTTGLGINGECLPQRDNALVLSGEVDEHGIPRAEVSFTAGANEKALMRHATDVMVRILEAAGATSTRVLDRAAHTLGTCRMATTRRTAWWMPRAAATRSRTSGSSTTRPCRAPSPPTPPSPRSRSRCGAPSTSSPDTDRPCRSVSARERVSAPRAPSAARPGGSSTPPSRRRDG